MGYASYLVYRDGLGEARNLALGLYASTLVLKTIANPLITQYTGRLVVRNNFFFSKIDNLKLFILQFYLIKIERVGAQLVGNQHSWMHMVLLSD
jgi:hypothetical protein